MLNLHSIPLKNFGNWTEKISSLTEEFKNNSPFSHCVINNFFETNLYRQILNNFPSIQQKGWKHYNIPIEKKYATLEYFPEIFSLLQTDDFLKMVSKISDIKELENDPHLHGAGLHFHPNQGKLDMHLDYSIHPISGKERRLNLIIYLNDDWKEEYNGALELWDVNLKHCEKKYFPFENRAIIFQTSDISWHGLPTPIKCPSNTGRKSIAIYYISDKRQGATLRSKAEFKPLPYQPVNDKLQKLFDIRPTRLIDVSDLWEGWETDKMGEGFWW